MSNNSPKLILKIERQDGKTLERVIIENRDNILYILDEAGLLDSETESFINQPQEINPLKKAKLNYMPAVSHTEPVAKIPVSSSELAKLDTFIREKVKQNHDQSNASRDNFKDSIYG